MILAIDLGKTSCRVAAGGRRAEGAGAPGLAAPGGVRAAEAAILAVARELGPAEEIDEVIVGAAGALAAPDAAGALGDALLASLRAQRVAVTSDAVIAHAGALDGKPGVVLIAGTGVVALAIGADGALRIADGWGPWLGDEGGGAWIGAAGLRAALRAHDGRGPSTTLLDAARARFGAPQTWPAQLTGAAALASFAPDVLAAEGDAAALAIVSDAAEALAATARAAGDGPVAMTGGLAGVLAGVDVLREQLDLVPAAGDALDGALRLGAIHEPHVIRVQADAVVPQGLDTLVTEAVRPGLDDLDARPIGEVVALLVAAEGEAHAAVAAAVPRIAAAAEAIAARLERGGRLIYAGAGTPGRLGVLDAAECGPTFGTDLVRGRDRRRAGRADPGDRGCGGRVRPRRSRRPDRRRHARRDHGVGPHAVRARGARARARGGRPDRRDRQQPEQRGVSRRGDRATDRARGARRLHAADRGDGPEGRAQHALDERDDRARQGLRTADGRRARDQREAAPPRRAHRP